MANLCPMRMTEPSPKRTAHTSLAAIPAVILAAAALFATPVCAGDLTVTGLRCEYAKSPLGVDLPNPRLGQRQQSLCLEPARVGDDGRAQRRRWARSAGSRSERVLKLWEPT